MNTLKYSDVNTLRYIARKFNLNIDVKRYPVEIPNFGRDGLAGLFSELNFKAGAEIGVEEGLYTEVLCRGNPQAVIYAVDPWKAYPDYREHVTQEKIDQLYENAKTRLAAFKNNSIMKGCSDVIVKNFANESLDFVYIDANHTLPFVIADIAEWSKRVRPGGIIAGHDYRINKGDGYRNHTVAAVHAWTSSYNIKPWFVLGSKAVVEGEVRDRPRSWMWVKE